MPNANVPSTPLAQARAILNQHDDPVAAREVFMTLWRDARWRASPGQKVDYVVLAEIAVSVLA